MTEIIFKIKEPIELEKLFSVLEELKIEYRTRTQKTSKKKQLNNDNIFEKIKNGALDIPDFDKFMLDFEESRKDRPLPIRSFTQA